MQIGFVYALMLRIREVILTFVFLSIVAFGFAQGQADDDSVSYSLFLVGDGGEPFVEKSPIGGALRKMVSAYSGKATVLYLGDNIYPGGLSDLGVKSRADGERILQTQVNWIKGLEANGIFIPGNHDWAHWGRHGLQYVLHQQEWIDSLHDNHFTLLPKQGCPGPVEVNVSNDLTLVILDTQWFIHQWEKPGEEGDCDGKTPADVLTLLNDILHRNYNKRVVIAAHHPLITYGNHGGYFAFVNHIFPLLDANKNLYIPMPVIGSLYPTYRKYFGHIQDNTHPLLKELTAGIRSILKEYPNSIYVAGHEHALQYIVKDSTHFIVSGSASKTSYVRKKGYAKFAESVTGFARLDVFKTGKSIVHFFQVDDDNPSGKEIYTAEIPTSVRDRDGGKSILPDFNKSVTVRASEQYRASGLKEKFLGENYRDEWATPVDVPVFDIGKMKGGLKILQKGGGQQTLSLRLEDSTGHEYVIRSVEKFPEKAVPEMLRKTFAQDLVQDQISASHPYAALAIPAMAEAAGIYHTNPELYFVPDDLRLGEYRKDFANTLVLFEERPAGDWSESKFFGNSKKIVNTAKVLEKLYEDNDNRVDQEFVLRSRLFDLVIGDWDRHDDQWRWASFKDKKSDVFRPIPRDRDQAFFVNEGWLSSVWSRKWALPKFEGFDNDIRWPSGLSFNARYFDRSFLNEVSKEQWIAAAKKLKADLKDGSIEKSIRQWPKEIFDLHGEEVIQKIKSRRDQIETYAVSHYEFLAREVEVVGSNKAEWFLIERMPDQSTKVEAYKITKEGERGKPFYTRTFLKSETKEIRIFGLGGDDRYEISGEEKSGVIKVRIIGGEGKDVVASKDNGSATGKNVIYYDSEAPSASLAKNSLREKISSDPEINHYDRKAFKYDRLAPLFFGYFNPDDGLFVGGGFVNIRNGFRKDPFKSRHIFVASVAPLTRSFNFKYQGKFTEAVGKWDFILNADVKSPNYVNNFFGLGNETVFNDDVEDVPGINVDESIDYYRYRFEELLLDPSLSRRIGNFASISLGPTFQRIEMEDPEGDEDRFIYDYASQLNEDLFDEYRSYAGAKWEFKIDHRDHPTFTRRGIGFQLAGRNMAGLNKDAANFSSYESSVSIIHSFRSNSRLVFAVRAGAGINTGDYAFYQAQVLDGRTELRGYRKTRFYGDKKFYSNFEARLRLLSFKSYLFPASFGVLAFHDLGRVWYKNEAGLDPSVASGKSNLWHKGYGGGLWFTPFNLTVLSTELATSDDGNMVYVRLGFLF